MGFKPNETVKIKQECLTEAETVETNGWPQVVFSKEQDGNVEMTDIDKGVGGVNENASMEVTHTGKQRTYNWSVESDDEEKAWKKKSSKKRRSNAKFMKREKHRKW